MDRYDFSPQERVFFAARLQELNTQQLVLRNAIALIISQQSLDGPWRISEDGASLERLEPALQNLLS